MRLRWVLGLILLGMIFGLTAGLMLTGRAGGVAADGAPIPKSRDWYDVADIIIRLVTTAIFTFGLIGTFALLTSLRASAYSQIYGRFQGVLLKLSDNPQLFERMKREEYTRAEDNPNDSNEPTKPHRFLANCIVNLYEEAFLLYESRILSVIETVPEDYWKSMLGSMRSAFQLKYVRTHWEIRQDVFSPKFNRFIREEILESGKQTTQGNPPTNKT